MCVENSNSIFMFSFRLRAGNPKIFFSFSPILELKCNEVIIIG